VVVLHSQRNERARWLEWLELQNTKKIFQTEDFVDPGIGADGVQICRMQDDSVRIKERAGIVGFDGPKVRFAQFEPIVAGAETGGDEWDGDFVGDAVLQHQVAQEVELELILARYEVHGDVVVDEPQRFARVLRQLVQEIRRDFTEFQAVALLAVEVVDALGVQSIWAPLSTVE